MKKLTLEEIDAGLTFTLKPTKAVEKCAVDLLGFILAEARIGLDVTADSNFCKEFIITLPSVQKPRIRTVYKAFHYLAYTGQLVHVGGTRIYQVNPVYYPDYLRNTLEGVRRIHKGLMRHLPDDKFKFLE